MNPFTLLYQTLSSHLFFWHWHDGIEIFFFSCLFYYLSMWLKKDLHKNLLPYFYGYCLIAFGAYFLELATIRSFLFLFWPATILLFMFVHQQTLQRNLIALKNITVKKEPIKDWIETILRISLHTMNSNKNMYCVIEHTDNISAFINTTLPITAHLDKELLELLFETHSYDPNKMIWINTQGQLCGINATWLSHHEFDEFNSTEWEQETLLYTAKTDTIAFHCDPKTHTFTLIIGEKILHNVSTHYMHQLIKNHCTATRTVSNVIQKGVNHDIKHTETTAK
ncbi:MAG: hypothetical protein Q8Q25_03395 [bacterium]|nr:hypothetical protein [bacterium]